MSAVTQLTQTSLEDTLSRYDIGALQRFSVAPNGIENSNYFISAQRDNRAHEYVLTILEQAANAGESYVPMMLALAEHGLPVAPPLPNLAGLYNEQTDGKPALLQPRIAGQHVFNPTTKQVCALARFVARMHLTLATCQVELKPYPRTVSWLEQQVKLTSGHVGYSNHALLEESLVKTKSLLSRDDVQSLPQGMIHGDLFRDNVLFNEHGLSGVLDFHHAAQGFWLYDLAVIANDWCTDATGLLDTERTVAMLRAYHHIRPLTDAEVWFFPGFALYAALVFWLSRLTTSLASKHDRNVRLKNPKEFQRILVQHNQHSLYLDKRLLEI